MSFLCIIHLISFAVLVQVAVRHYNFETRVAANKTNIDKILDWLEDKKDEDGTVTTQGILSKVNALWSDVENVTDGLKVKVSSQDQRVKTLEDLINTGWDEENESGSVSYDGYKTTIKKIYNQLSEKITATILTNTLKDYYTKTQAENKFVAQVEGKDLSDKNFTAEFETLLNTLKDEKWVKPVDGKGLSTNDFTTAEKSKLKDIEAEANKTEITKTLDDSETTVPSNKAVSDGLATKVNKDDIAVAIDSSNNTASDKVPSCAAVAAYVDSNISGALDTTVTGNSSASTISISNKTNGLCAVRITKMSDGSTQYQSNVKLNRPVNKTTAFIFNITASEPYMIEAWSYNSSTEKLIPTAVKYV